MPGVELQHDSADRRGATLNAALGIGFDSVNAMAEVLLLPSLVLAFFVAELTPSYVTIGLAPAVATSLWTLARVPALLLTGSRRRHQPWAFAAAATRAGAIAVLAVVASRTSPAGLAQSGRPLLVTFFLCLIVFSLAGGFGSVPTTALFRSSLPADSWGTFVRWRALWSAGLTLLGALLVDRLLGANVLAFPGDYGRLFLVATVFLIACAVFAAAMRESPSSAISAQPLPSARTFRQPLRDARYRRFLLFRILLSSTAAVDPFLFLYAVTRLGAPVSAIGSYAIAGVLGWIISAPLWNWLERTSGPQAVLQGAAVLRLVAPATALALPQITEIPFPQFGSDTGSPAPRLFLVAFFAIGAALAAQSRGNSSYLTLLSPRHLQAAFSGLTNGILAAVAFAPVLGGLVIQRTGYEVLFVGAIVVGLVAVFLGGWLGDVSTKRLDRSELRQRSARGDPALPPSRL